MKEYVEFPKFFRFSNIKSNNFSKIKFRKYELKKQKNYSMKILRDLYKINKSLFFDVKDEFLLRGVVFHSNSNYFPEYLEENPMNYIFIDPSKKTENYKNIKFEELGLGDIVKRFNISDDRFFNNVNLNHFKYLNKTINLRLLKEAFLVNNFNIVEKNIYDSKEKDDLKKLKDFPRYYVNQEYWGTIRINDLLTSEMFNGLIKYLNDRKKFYIEEIYESDLEYYFKNYYDINEHHIKMFLDLVQMQSQKIFIFKDISRIKSISYLDALNKYMKKNTELYQNMNQWLFSNHLENKALNNSYFKERIFDINYFNYDKNIYDLSNYSFNEFVKYFDKLHTLENDLLINEIIGKRIDSLPVSDNDKFNIKSLNYFLNVIQSPSYYFYQSISNFDQREKDIIIRRLVGKETLNNIGDYYNITRERVRQIQIQTKEKFEKNIKRTLLKDSIILQALSQKQMHNNLISFNFIEEILEVEPLLFYELIKDKEYPFIVLDKYKLLGLTKESVDAFIIDEKKIISELPEIFIDIKDVGVLNSFLEISKLIDIEQFAEANGYSKTGKIFHRSNLTKDVIAKVILNNEGVNQINPKTKDFQNFIKISKEKYDIDIINNYKSYFNILSRSDYFIQIESNTFRFYESDLYDDELILDCMEFIEKELKSRDSINIETVYNSFIHRLQESGINHKIHLYSVLKKKFDDYFIFGKGNTLNIFKSESSKHNINDEMISFIESSTGIKNIYDIMKKFKLSKERAKLKIINNKNIISWGENLFRTNSKLIKNIHIDIVKNIIKNLLHNKGFFTDVQLYTKSLEDPNIYQLAILEGIDTPEKFRSIFRKHINILKGKEKIIFDKNKYSNVEEIIIYMYPNGFTRKELIDYFNNQLGLIDYHAINIMESKYFVEVSFDKYIPYEDLNLTRDEITQIIDLAKRNMVFDLFVPIKKISDYKYILGDNKILSHYLIRDILKRFGYTEIDVKYIKINSMIIMVESKTKINRADKLLVNIIKNNYKGEMNELSLAKFMVDIGLVNSKESNLTSIPRGFYEGSDIIKIDEIGRIIIKE